MIYPIKDQKSWIEPYNQRDHAWNTEQHDQSHHKTWDHETKNPSGYQVLPGSLHQMQRQHMIYPIKDQKSWIVPYNQRDHAWNTEQHDQSHDKTWDHETKNPSGYQVLPGSLMETRYPVETHSKIIPYKQREHAWTMDHHDLTHITEYMKAAPKGYDK